MIYDMKAITALEFFTCLSEAEKTVLCCSLGIYYPDFLNKKFTHEGLETIFKIDKKNYPTRNVVFKNEGYKIKFYYCGNELSNYYRLRYSKEFPYPQTNEDFIRDCQRVGIDLYLLKQERNND